MKSPLIISLLFLFGCSDLQELNNEIYETQIKALSESPYKNASYAKSYIDAQKEFRISKFYKPLQKRLLSAASVNDTVFITETFDEICMGCSSDWMKVLIRDTIYSFNKEILGHRGGVTYSLKSEYFNIDSKDNYQFRDNEFIEIVRKIRRGETWRDAPLKYGSDDCADGDHTMVTIIYPDKHIETLYVRCWMAEMNRHLK